MFNIWVSLTIFWLFQKSWFSSPAPPSATHPACLLDLGQLHPYGCCCSWWSSRGTGISQVLWSLTGLCLNQPSLQRLSLGILPLPHGIRPQFPNFSPWPLHTFKAGTTCMTLTRSTKLVASMKSSLVPSGPQFCVLSHRNTCQILPQWYWSLLNHSWFSSPSWLASIIPAKQSFHSSGS